MSTFNEMNEVWDAWVTPGNTPARACVESKLAAPQFTVEIRSHRGAGLRRPASHAHRDSGGGPRRDHQRLGVPSRRSRGNRPRSRKGACRFHVARQRGTYRARSRFCVGIAQRPAHHAALTPLWGRNISGHPLPAQRQSQAMALAGAVSRPMYR